MKRANIFLKIMCRVMSVAVLASVLLIPLAAPSHAASMADTCTDQPLYDVFLDERLDSILGDIIELVEEALATVAQDLYEGIVGSPNYTMAVYAAMMLFLIFYAVSFLFGFVPANFGQALIRIIKMGIVFLIMSPEGWDYFDEIVVNFFEEGTNWLIDLMIDIGGGDSAQGHFSIMEPLMIMLFSPKMFVLIVASLTTGPFGPIMAMALLWSLFNIFLMILKALEVYLLAMIIRTLLFGLAPIFFVMMFFERTKNIFMGYINQLVNFMLQPVLLFAFLAFFVTMIESAADTLINREELCYTKMEHLGKMPYDIQHWRFKVDGGPYEGEWTWKGCIDCDDPDPFPIPVIDILIFLILAHIGIKMSQIVVEIASEIAQSTMRLSEVPGTINSYFNNLRGGAGHGLSSADMAWRSQPGKP